MPLPPTHPKIPFADKEHITFSWTAPANSLNVTYVVEIKSDFYHYNMSAVVHHHTQYNFTGLKSGTKYDLAVKTKAGGNYSVPADISHCTGETLRPKRLDWLYCMFYPIGTKLFILYFAITFS